MIIKLNSLFKKKHIDESYIEIICIKTYYGLKCIYYKSLEDDYIQRAILQSSKECDKDFPDYVNNKYLEGIEMTIDNAEYLFSFEEIIFFFNETYITSISKNDTHFYRYDNTRLNFKIIDDI